MQQQQYPQYQQYKEPEYKVRPTWGLAWGLMWRMIVLQLPISIIYIIILATSI